MSINLVCVVGNLTRDPELKQAGSTTVCTMRIAVNDRVKDQQTGEWGNRPNFFNVDVFGARGDNCATFLKKGSKITVKGRLRWREWETQEGGKREAVSIVGDDVEFPSRRDEQEAAAYQKPAAPPQEDFREQARQDTDETFAGGDTGGDDDIPF